MESANGEHESLRDVVAALIKHIEDWRSYPGAVDEWSDRILKAIEPSDAYAAGFRAATQQHVQAIEERLADLGATP